MTGRPNPPKRHHYLPEFHLRQWCGETGKLQRYTAVCNNAVKTKRVFPSQIGFEQNLYAMPGESVDDWNAQKLETHFFGPLDNKAAQCLAMLLNQDPAIKLTGNRSIWSTYILSLFHRTPQHLGALHRQMKKIYEEQTGQYQDEYEKFRGPNDPETFEEWELKQDALIDEKRTLSLLPGLIANSRLGDFTMKMRWTVKNVENVKLELLLSDNPVIFSPLKKPMGHIVMPLSPTKLFIASNDQDFHNYVSNINPIRLVKDANKLVVQNATQFVVAADMSQDYFIRKHFGTKIIGSLVSGFR